MGKKQLVIAIVIAGHDGIVADGLYPPCARYPVFPVLFIVKTSVQPRRHGEKQKLINHGDTADTAKKQELTFAYFFAQWVSMTMGQKPWILAGIKVSPWLK
jgi:hypothetical protein